jgi:hypothetical protein
MSGAHSPPEGPSERIAISYGDFTHAAVGSNRQFHLTGHATTVDHGALDRTEQQISLRNERARRAALLVRDRHLCSPDQPHIGSLPFARDLNFRTLHETMR